MLKAIFGDFFGFVSHAVDLIVIVRGVLLSLIMILTLTTIALGYVEDLSFGQALYFASITGLTIGYGDYSPTTALGQVICVVHGCLGVVFVGMVVAIANRALQWTSNDKLQVDDPIARTTTTKR